MTVEGIDKLKARFAKLGKGLMTAAHPAMLAGADDIVATARLLVPVDDGQLRSTIRHSDIKKTRRKKNDMVEILAGDESTIVGTRARFQLARIIEFGTTTRQAEPFMRPAMRRHKNKIRRAMRGAISAAVRGGM